MIFDDIEHYEVTEKPEDGSFCYGMFFEGARWNSVTHVIDESQPKQLYSAGPMLLFLPKRNRIKPDPLTTYNCPMYKVLSRAGTLSTTGHSTNFCLWLEFPTQRAPERWIRAGVAVFLALLY
jgi:dynein heavy chain